MNNIVIVILGVFAMAVLLSLPACDYLETREREMTERAYVLNGYQRQVVGSGWNERLLWVKQK